MENPDGLENPSVVTSLNTDITTAGSYRGRQPNLVINVEGPTCLERSGSPLATEIQHFHKKGRSLVVTESDVTMGDGAVAQIGVLVREPLVVANSGSVEVCSITPSAETTEVAGSVPRNPGAVFGPWMQAPSHRRRNAPLKKDVGSVAKSSLPAAKNVAVYVLDSHQSCPACK
ncbi:hypothetical protein V6N13_028932 [Hibiscus sabdariffa]